jgi:hypothetical protein
MASEHEMTELVDALRAEVLELRERLRMTETQLTAIHAIAGTGATGERRADLVSRSLTAEHEVASVRRSHTIYRDRIALAVVDTNGGRWRVHVLREAWSAPG